MEFQSGFTGGRSTIGHILTAKMMMENLWEYKFTFQIFVRYKQAYDNVHRDLLCNIFSNSEKATIYWLKHVDSDCPIRAGKDFTS